MGKLEELRTHRQGERAFASAVAPPRRSLSWHRLLPFGARGVRAKQKGSWRTASVESRENSMLTQLTRHVALVLSTAALLEACGASNQSANSAPRPSLEACPTFADPEHICDPSANERCLSGTCYPADKSWPSGCDGCPDGQICVSAGSNQFSTRCIDPWTEQPCGPNLRKNPNNPDDPPEVGYCFPAAFCTLDGCVII